MSKTDVLVRAENGWGHITLNRPRALNALTDSMCTTIDAALLDWTHNDAIFGVLIDGAGERGFCAGGDIRALYEMGKAGNIDPAAGFFEREYRLNARIGRFPKPYVALMDGITMGGGVGLSAHGAYRVVTERTMLAMPEVSIGMIPDVGGTWLLGRVPGGLGIHVALTAMRLSGADAIGIDLADVFVESDRLDNLRAAILASRTRAELDDAFFAVRSEPPTSRLLVDREWITRCYNRDDVKDILAALDASPETEARHAAMVIRAQSPTALKLTLRALRTAVRLGALEPCLDQEFRLALRCIVGHDFIEGVRAAVIDKDRTPRWSPDRLDAVTDTAIDACFADLGAMELRLGVTAH